MAYNNGFPVNYQQYYPQYQVQPQMPQQQAQQVQQPQIQQHSGFIPVNSEQEARMYPVAAGNSVTFIDENLPYCYVKTMGFSQLDRPKFEKYRLVKEEDAQAEDDAPKVEYLTKDVLESIKTDFDSVWDELNELKEKVSKMTKRRVMKEVEIDE